MLEFVVLSDMISVHLNLLNSKFKAWVLSVDQTIMLLKTPFKFNCLLPLIGEEGYEKK